MTLEKSCSQFLSVHQATVCNTWFKRKVFISRHGSTQIEAVELHRLCVDTPKGQKNVSGCDSQEGHTDH